MVGAYKGTKMMADPKVCTDCKIAKPRAAFGKHWKAKNGVRSKCKECDAAYQRKLNKTKPERLKIINRRSKLKRTFGLSIADYDAMLQTQGGGCALCGAKTSGGKGDHFHVDHCHKTKKIRGLLCHFCNVGLGHFKEDQVLMARAIQYLATDGDYFGK